MVKSTGRQIEKDAGRMLAVYDELIEEKSKQLSELKEKENELKAEQKKEISGVGFPIQTNRNKSVHNESVSLKAVPFHDDTYVSSYKRIKEGFSVDSESLAENFVNALEAESSEESEYRKLIADMLDTFSFENTYKLSLLEKDKYELVLRDVLNNSEYEIYSEWAIKNTSKNISEFRDWLKLEYERTDNLVKVRIPSNSTEHTDASDHTKLSETDDRIRYENDNSICEGAKIIYKNKLYDYSI
ncbi:MAG: hypothetical protein Q4B86_04850 [Eubacteriales bacterium]|nr:hypothetical protein [Eubacteriales bacterium]